MPDTVVKIENLGKKYRLTHKRPQKYIALRDVLVDRTKRLAEKLTRPFGSGKNSASDVEDFWALRDVSFDVKRGERIGIIGRNGAGKSTLLKILSRITEPTTGRVSIKGRIASLLEVGTGFHPELTGRENIFLNGAILGMSKAEIKKNFDAIVAFAGVEQFLDTPVKHYSSGMYVRLAFSVAAHLDTEILLVDEVLAVGDAEFQKKCMGKMDEVSHKEGRTILFVSHNMGAIRQLCSRVVLLGDGKVVFDTEDVAKGTILYLHGKQHAAPPIWTNPGGFYPNRWFSVRRFGLCDKNSNAVGDVIDRQDDVWVLIEGVVEDTNPALAVGYVLYSDEGALLFYSLQSDLENSDDALGLLDKTVRLRSKFPVRYLNDGTYSMEVAASIYKREWINQPRVCSPNVSFKVEGAFSLSPYWTENRGGLLAPLLTWEKF